MWFEDHERNINIKGIVVASEWDESGNVMALALLTYDEDEYGIQGKYWEQKLKNFLHEPVEVHGSLLKRNGKKMILIKRCTITSM